MKRIIILGIFIFMLFSPISVFASNKIYNMDISINILEDGTANITEVWDVDGDDGTEWYKVMNGLGNALLSDFTVSMDGIPLKYKNWNVNESLSAKKGYYGINYTSSGLELCFGKYDYKRHTFILSYTLTNYIINVEDGQVLYWNLIDTLSNVDFRNFSVTVSSYYEFPDNLDVWGFGYKGYAYVSNGKIYMSNDGNMKNSYVVLLAKFPLNTFNTMNSKVEYNTFDDVYNRAEKGTYSYNYDDDDDSFDDFLDTIAIIAWFILSIFIPGMSVVISLKNGYGYNGNKTINKKNVPMFRDIPCNKDIYYANTLIKLNNFDYKSTNIFGAIMLKWIRDNKIGFRNEVKGVFNKETSVIDLTMNPTFDDEIEKELFEIMYKASGDGFLEAKELEKWCRSHYEKFFGLFERMNNREIEILKRDGHIYHRINKKECKRINVMDDMIYDDSTKLYGLKKYLQEFSSMKTKEVFEVHMWDEYLMFAYLFGMAEKVAKQFKNMYPEVVEQMESINFDYGAFIFINNISSRSVSAASSARSAAESYSSGGGGFSSGGGGGGSFGGGGGGSR